MNTHTKDTFVFITLLGLVVIWVFHIPYTISPNVIKAFFSSYEKPHKFILIDMFCLLCSMACFMMLLCKRYLDSKWQPYRWYRICATLIANGAFIFAWCVVFSLSIAFHCRYYWAINCKDNAESDLCSNFPIEIDIAYLLQCVPMLFMLVLILYFASYNKILSCSNCLWLSWLLFIMLISIMVCFGGNGVGCYD
ncbi:hypothetical protein HPU229336_00155 [Helicobacter pullorum]|uniref:Inner membrane protein n=1 Tax=Helicobacter pullorum TaxID=35818 RepID=A0AAW3J567_9HELI|nr:hypothetical protein [Helicobacter pullorum]KPH51561.1 hypothetical protein HPU229336_00155 [Helicobacter pullorum]